MEYITHHTHTPAGREGGGEEGGGGEREIKVILVILLMFVYLSSVCVVKSCLKTGSNTKHTASVQGALEKHTDKHSNISMPPSCSLIFQYKFSCFSVFYKMLHIIILQIFLIFQYFQYFSSTYAQNSVKLLANLYT